MNWLASFTVRVAEIEIDTHHIISADSEQLSGPLQSGIRFFHTPLPALPTAFLTVGLPRRGSNTGLLCSVQFARDGLGSAYPPVVLVSVPLQPKKRGPTTFPFGSGLPVSLACFGFTMFISSSHILTIPSRDARSPGA
jgi:hypothetical protein